MENIFEKNTHYERWLPTVNWIFRHSFRRIHVIGRENIPTDGAIIYSPNHSNALIDALMILALDNQRKVFVARADIFRKPRAAAILHWLKMMPIRRIRDGINEVRQNDETLQTAVETLRHEVPFCIMPEGTHRPSRTLLPLNKGIFRIALMADEQIEKPVYIVPVGINYADFFHLWTNVDVRIGKAINVSEYRKDHVQLTYPELLLAMREDLSERMQALVYEPEKRTANKPLTAVVLLLTLPFFLLCWILSFPAQIAKPIIRNNVKDPCFRNSVQFVLQLLLTFLSLGLIYLPLMISEEWLYQFRTNLSSHNCE